MKKVTIQFIGAFIVLLIVVATYAVWYAEIRAESGKAAGLAAEIKQKSAATTRIASAKAQLAELAPQEREVSQYFISTNDVVPFLEQLAQTGKFLGATVDVSSVSAAPGTPYGTLNISLKITGSFESVMRTLGSIEYGPYNIHTTAVTLDSDSQQGAKKNSPVWTATATFVISTQALPAATTHTPLPAQPVAAPASLAPPAASSSINSASTTKTGVATPST